MAINKINGMTNHTIAQVKGLSLTEQYLSSLEQGRGLTISENGRLSGLSQFYRQYQTQQLDTSEYLLNLKDYDLQISAEERDSIFIESLMADSQSVLAQAFGYSDKLNGYTAVHNYINPFDSQVAKLLSNLYQQGIIKQNESVDDQIKDMYNYVISNFDYVCEEKDDWNFAAETIAQGYGDCEDLAILTASLGMAIMINNGISYAEANHRFLVVAGKDLLYGDHVRVEYLADDGNCYIVDPANATGGRISQISSLSQVNQDNFEVYFRFNDSKVLAPYEVKQDSFSQYLRADDPAARELLQEIYQTGLLDNIDDYREAAAQIYHYMCRNFDLIEGEQLLPDTGYTQAGKEGTQESLSLLLSNALLAFCQDKELALDKIAMAQIEKNGIGAGVVLVQDYTGAERVFDFSGMFSSGLADIRQTEVPSGDFQETMQQFFGYDNFARLSDLKKNGIQETRRHDLNNNLIKRTVKRFNPKAGAFSTYAAVVPIANPFALDDKSMKELTDKSTYETHNIQNKLDGNSFINGSLLMGANTSTVGEKPAGVQTDVVVEDTASGIALELSKKIKEDVKQLFNYNKYIDSSTKARGFWSVDVSEFEKTRKNLLAKLRINNVLAMVKQAEFEGYNLVYKELTGNDGYESMDVGRIYQKEMQTLDKAATAVKKDMQDYVELRNQLRKTLVERANEWSMADVNKKIGIAALSYSTYIMAVALSVAIPGIASGSAAVASGVGVLAGLALLFATASAVKGITGALAITSGAQQLAMAISAAVAAGKQHSLTADEYAATDKALKAEQKDLLNPEDKGQDPISVGISTQYQCLQEIVETDFDEQGNFKKQYSEKAVIYKKENEINNLQAVANILVKIKESNLNSRALIHQEMTGVNGRKAAGIGSINLSNEQEYIKSRLADVKAKRTQLVGLKTALSEAKYNYDWKIAEAVAYGIAFAIGYGLEIAKAVYDMSPLGMSAVMGYVQIPFAIKDMIESQNAPMPEQLKAKDFLDKSAAPIEGFYDSTSGKLVKSEKYNLYSVLDEAVKSGFVYVGSGISKGKVVSDFAESFTWGSYGYGSIYRKNIIKAKEKFLTMANVLKANIMIQRYEKESRNLIHQEMTDNVPIQEMTDLATTMVDNEIAYLNSALAAIVSREEARVGIMNKKLDAFNRHGRKIAGNVTPFRLLGAAFELTFMGLNLNHSAKINTDTFQKEMEDISFKNPAYLPGSQNATGDSLKFSQDGTQVNYLSSGFVYEVSKQNRLPLYTKRAYFVDTEKIKKMTEHFLGLVTVIQCYASALGSWSAGRSNIHQELTGKSSLRLSNVSQNVLSSQSKQFMEYAGLVAKMADDYAKLCQKKAEGLEEMAIATNNLVAAGVVFTAVLAVAIIISVAIIAGNLTIAPLYAETVAGTIYGLLESVLGFLKALQDRFFAKFLEKEVAKKTKMDEKAKEYSKKTQKQGDKEEASDEAKSGSDSLFGQMVSGMLYKSHLEKLQKLKTALNETKKKNGESRSLIKGKISGVAGGYSSNAAAMISMLESSATTVMLDSMISAVRSADAQIKQIKAGANLVGAISSLASAVNKVLREAGDGSWESDRFKKVEIKGEAKKQLIEGVMDKIKNLPDSVKNAIKDKLKDIKNPAEVKAIVKNALVEAGLLGKDDKENESDKYKLGKELLGSVESYVKDFAKGYLDLSLQLNLSPSSNDKNTPVDYAKHGAKISDASAMNIFMAESFAAGKRDNSSRLGTYGGSIWESFKEAGKSFQDARDNDKGSGGQDFLKQLKAQANENGVTDENIAKTLGVKDLSEIKSVSQLSSLIKTATGQEGEAGQNAKKILEQSGISKALGERMGQIAKSTFKALGLIMLGVMDFLKAVLVDGQAFKMERRGRRTGSVSDEDPTIVAVDQPSVTVQKEEGTKITKTTPQKGTLEVVNTETEKDTQKKSYQQSSDANAQGLNGNQVDQNQMAAVIDTLLKGEQVDIRSISVMIGDDVASNLEFNRNRAVSDLIRHLIETKNYQAMDQLGLGGYLNENKDGLNAEGEKLQAAYQKGEKANDSNDIRWKAANTFREANQANLKIVSDFAIHETGKVDPTIQAELSKAEGVGLVGQDWTDGTKRGYKIDYQTTTESAKTVAHNFEYTRGENKYSVRRDATSGEVTITPQDGAATLSEQETKQVIDQVESLVGKEAGTKLHIGEKAPQPEYSYVDKTGTVKTFATEEAAEKAMIEDGLSKNDKFTIIAPDGKPMEGVQTEKEAVEKVMKETYGIDLDKMDFKSTGAGNQVAVAGLADVDDAAEFSNRVKLEDVNGKQLVDDDLQKEIADNDQEALKGLTTGKYLRLKGKDGKVKYEKLKEDTPEGLREQAMNIMSKNLGEVSGANASVKLANWLRHTTGGEERGMVLESLIDNLIAMITRIVEEKKESALRQAEMDEKMALVLALSRGSKNLKVALELLHLVNQEALENDQEKNSAEQGIFESAFKMTLDAAKLTASFIPDEKLNNIRATQIKRIQGDIDNVDKMLKDKTDVQAKVGDNNTVNVTVKLPEGVVVEFTVTGVSPEEAEKLINDKGKAFKEKFVSQARKYIEMEAQKAVADLKKTYQENAQSDEPDKKPKVHPFVVVGLENALNAVLKEMLAATKETSSDDKAPKDKMMADKKIVQSEPQTPASNAEETAEKAPEALKIEVKLVKNDQDSLQKVNEMILAAADIHAAGKTSKVPVACIIKDGKEYVVVGNGENEEKYLVDRSQSNENRVYLTPVTNDGKNDYSIIIEKDGNEVRFFKVKNGKKVRVEKGSKEYKKLNLAQLDGPVGLRVFEARSQYRALREEQMKGDIPVAYSIAPGSNPKEIDDFISSLPEGTYILKCGKTEVKVAKEVETVDGKSTSVCKYYFPDSGDPDTSGVLVARLKAQALGKPANEQAYISYVQTFDVSKLGEEQLKKIAQLAQDSDRYSFDYDPKDPNKPKTLTITGEKLGTTEKAFTVEGKTDQVTEAEMLFGSTTITASEEKIQTSGKDTAEAMRTLAIANTVKNSDFRNFASHYQNLQQIGANLQSRTKDPVFQMCLGLFADQLDVDASGKPVFKGDIKNLNLESFIEDFLNSKSPKELKKLFKEMEKDPALKEILKKFKDGDKKNAKIDLESFTEFLAIYQLRNLETLGLIPKGKAEEIIDGYIKSKLGKKFPPGTIIPGGQIDEAKTKFNNHPQLSPELQKSFQIWFQEKASLQRRLNVIAKHYRNLLEAFSNLSPADASGMLLSMFLNEGGRDGQILQNLAQLIAQADANRIQQIELYRKQILENNKKKADEAQRILKEVEKDITDAKEQEKKAKELEEEAKTQLANAENLSVEATKKAQEATKFMKKAEEMLAQAGDDQEKIKLAEEAMKQAQEANKIAKQTKEKAEEAKKQAQEANKIAKQTKETAEEAKKAAKKNANSQKVIDASEAIEQIASKTSWLPEGMQQGDFALINRRYSHNQLMLNRLSQVAQKANFLKERIRIEGLFNVSYDSYWDMIFEANVKADADNFHQVARAEEQFADFSNRLAAAKSLSEKLAILSAENKLNATAQKYLLGLLQDGQINIDGKIYTIEYSNNGTYLKNDQKDDFIIIRDDQGKEVAKFSEDQHGVIVLTMNSQNDTNNGLDTIALKEVLNSTSMLAWDKICNGSQGLKFMTANDAAAKKFRIETFFDHGRMKLERRINTKYPHKDYNVTKEESQLQMLALDQLQKNGYAIFIDGYSSYARVEGAFGEGDKKKEYTLLKFADGSYQLEIGNEKKITFRMEDLQDKKKVKDILAKLGFKEITDKEVLDIVTSIEQTSAKILDADKANEFIEIIIKHNFDEAKITKELGNFKIDNSLVKYNLFVQNASKNGWITEQELQKFLQNNGDKDWKDLMALLKEKNAIVQDGDKIIINSRYVVDQTLKEHQAEITDWDKLIKKAEKRQGELDIHAARIKTSLVDNSKITDQTFLTMAEKNGYLSVKEFKDSLEIKTTFQPKDVLDYLVSKGAIYQKGNLLILRDPAILKESLEVIKEKNIYINDWQKLFEKSPEYLSYTSKQAENQELLKEKVGQIFSLIESLDETAIKELNLDKLQLEQLEKIKKELKIKKSQESWKGLTSKQKIDKCLNLNNEINKILAEGVKDSDKYLLKKEMVSPEIYGMVQIEDFNAAIDLPNATAEKIIADLKSQGAILQEGDNLVLVDEKLIDAILKGDNAEIKGGFASLSQKALDNKEKSKVRVYNSELSSLKKQDEYLEQWRAIYAKNQEREENQDQDIYYLELRSVGAITDEELDKIELEKMSEKQISASVEPVKTFVRGSKNIEEGKIGNPEITAAQITVHETSHFEGSTKFSANCGFAKISDLDKQQLAGIIKKDDFLSKTSLISMMSLTPAEVNNQQQNKWNPLLLNSRNLYTYAITLAEMIQNGQIVIDQADDPQFMNQVKMHYENLLKIPATEVSVANAEKLLEEKQASLEFFAQFAPNKREQYYTIGQNCVQGMINWQNSSWGEAIGSVAGTGLKVYDYVVLPGQQEKLPIVGYMNDDAKTPIIYYPNNEKGKNGKIGEYGMRANLVQYQGETPSTEFTGDFEAKITIDGKGEIYVSKKGESYELLDPLNIFSKAQQTAIKNYLTKHSDRITAEQLKEACVFSKPSSFDYHSVTGLKTVCWSIYDGQPVYAITLNGQELKFEELPKTEQDLITKTVADRRVDQQEVETTKYCFAVSQADVVADYEIISYPTGDFQIYQDGIELSKVLSQQAYGQVSQAVADILKTEKNVDTKLQELLTAKYPEIVRQQLVVSMKIGSTTSQVLFDQQGIPLKIDGRKITADEPGYQALLAVGEAALDGEIAGNELSLVENYGKDLGLSSAMQTFKITVAGQKYQIVYDSQGKPVSVNGQKVPTDSDLYQKLLAIFEDLNSGNSEKINNLLLLADLDNFTKTEVADVKTS